MAAQDVMVAVVCSIDPVLRDTTVGVLVRRLPRAVALVDGRAVNGSLPDAAGSDCPLCAAREELLAAVTALIGGSRPPEAIVLGLPAGAGPDLLHGGVWPAGARRGPVLAALDGTTLEWGLSERELFGGWALAESDGDEHPIGQTVMDHLTTADLLVTPAPLAAHSRRLVDEVAGPVPDHRIADLRPGILAGVRPWLAERSGAGEPPQGSCPHRAVSGGAEGERPAPPVPGSAGRGSAGRLDA